jgi:D-sedoheptulose 7-phosphate isomerase
MNVIDDYLDRASRVLASLDRGAIAKLADAIGEAWDRGAQVLVCGNGGSAANAEHFVNDLVFGVSAGKGDGVRALALSANSAVFSCIANDMGYEQVFSYQVSVLGRPGDLLLALSGSGNSPNIVRALETARDRGLTTAAIVGYRGGKAKPLADLAVHVDIDDMQLSEDFMQIVAHAVSRQLATKRAAAAAAAPTGIVP